MRSIEEIEKRRREIVEALLKIRSMRPGNINYQYVQIVREGKPGRRGPYPVLCWREGKAVYSERLKGEREVELAEGDVANQKQFRALCSELEELTRGLGKLEREESDLQQEVKKKRRSPSSKARKSAALCER